MPNVAHEGEIGLRIQGLEAMRERMTRDIDGQILSLRRLLPTTSLAARYGVLRRWVKENGGWRGYMSGGPK